MADDQVNDSPVTDETPLVRIYSPQTKPLMQSLLATLADLDLEHDRDLARVNSTSTEPTVKKRVVERLVNQHRQRRAPYVQQLALLQRRAMSGRG